MDRLGHHDHRRLLPAPLPALQGQGPRHLGQRDAPRARRRPPRDQLGRDADPQLGLGQGLFRAGGGAGSDRRARARERADGGADLAGEIVFFSS